MVVDFGALDENKAYKVMSCSIFPRPIAWIVTEGDGGINIAPFSYFAPLSSAPAVVVVSIGLKEDGSPKDTRVNILKRKKATVCLAEKQMLNRLACSSEEYPYGVSEADECRIETVRILDEFPPIIEGVKAAYFCDFYGTCEIEGSETLPLLLEIKKAFFEDARVDEKLNLELFNIGRVGREFLVDGERVGG